MLHVLGVYACAVVQWIPFLLKAAILRVLLLLLRARSFGGGNDSKLTYFDDKTNKFYTPVSSARYGCECNVSCDGEIPSGLSDYDGNAHSYGGGNPL